MKKQYFKLKEDGGFVVETNNGNINADGTQIVIKGGACSECKAE